jgi:hypothetical protein
MDTEETSLDDFVLIYNAFRKDCEEPQVSMKSSKSNKSKGSANSAKISPKPKSTAKSKTNKPHHNNQKKKGKSRDRDDDSREPKRGREYDRHRERSPRRDRSNEKKDRYYPHNRYESQSRNSRSEHQSASTAVCRYCKDFNRHYNHSFQKCHFLNECYKCGNVGHDPSRCKKGNKYGSDSDIYPTVPNSILSDVMFHRLNLSVSGPAKAIFDSGASVSVSSKLADFYDYRRIDGHVTVADGQNIPVRGQGTLLLKVSHRSVLRLKQALHVPAISQTLISISQITTEYPYMSVIFNDHGAFLFNTIERWSVKISMLDPATRLYTDVTPRKAVQLEPLFVDIYSGKLREIDRTSTEEINYIGRADETDFINSDYFANFLRLPGDDSDASISYCSPKYLKSQLPNQFIGTMKLHLHEEWRLWHRRFAHISYGTLKETLLSDKVTGVNTKALPTRRLPGENTSADHREKRKSKICESDNSDSDTIKSKTKPNNHLSEVKYTFSVDINLKPEDTLPENAWLELEEIFCFTVCECPVCAAGKIKRRHLHSSEYTVTQILETLGVDCYGPIKPQSVRHFRHGQIIIDFYSRFIMHNLMNSKNLATDLFISTIEKVERKKQKFVQNLRFDNGELKTNKLRDYCQNRKNQIEWELTPPYSPQFGGIYERQNQTLADMVRCMLLQSNLPDSFWCYAFEHAVFLKNRVIHSKTKEIPYSIWTGRPPNFSRLFVFGCLCFVHTLKKDSPKLAVKGMPAIFLGYHKTDKIARFFDLNKRIFIESAQFTALESIFPGIKKRSLQEYYNLSPNYGGDSEVFVYLYCIITKAEGSSEQI